MRAALSNMLKSFGFVSCDDCDGDGLAKYPLGKEPPGDCPACEGSGVVRRPTDPIPHDDFRPEAP